MQQRNPVFRTAILCLLAAAAPALAAGECSPPPTAQYTVTLDAVWSAETHPQDFPSNPHLSGLIGATHDDLATFWAAGELASQGIESMAESGLKGDLITEFEAEIALGHAEEIISGGGVNPSPGSISLTFDVSLAFSEVTLVSMIAPSPDWFIGVAGLPLFDGERWLDEVVVDLHPYDAGTDSGVTYTSPNMDTQPPEPIAEMTGYPFLNGTEVLPLGTFTFTRVGAPCLDLCVDGLVGGQQATFTVDGGVPGAQVAVLWGTQDGQWQQSSEPWCVDFGFAVPGGPGQRLVTLGTVDASGSFAATRTVDPGLSGRSFRFQAALSGTCPTACMSQVVTTLVE